MESSGQFGIKFSLKGINAQFIVSIDGTKFQHEFIRGLGTYERIKKNINEDCIIVMTITEQNKLCIKDFYAEWIDKVKGIRFNFYSSYSENDRQQILDRDKVIEDLEGMDILNPFEELQAWRSINIEETRKNCAEKQGLIKRLDCMGNPKICNNKLCSANYCTLPKLMVKV